MTAQIKVQRIDLALTSNAAIDRLITRLVQLKNANIKSAQANDSWYLIEEYLAAKEAMAVFEEDRLDVVMRNCADILREEHSYDIQEKCFLNDDGDPRYDS